MTPHDAIAYASEILEKHQQMNTAYTANAELARHAQTATLLVEFAARVEQLEAQIATPAETVEPTLSVPRKVTGKR